MSSQSHADRPGQHTLADELGFDPAELREKYRAERDKRLREDGNEQYLEVTGDFSHYADDSYVDPGFVRAPLHDEVDVVIVGGGFGGLILGARLREAGMGSIRIIEKGGDFGGTWYWNRYPGAACDVESYIYLPLIEEVGTVPSRKYVRAAEILAHSKAIAEKYDLYKNACLQTEVAWIDWDEQAARWILQTNRSDRIRAKFVCLAPGPLSRPKLPGIRGISKFLGHTFHTSRWDFDYTGGDAGGNLHKLKDKSVGIIGTGATAVQCVPHLGASSKELYVFQRTPSSIDARNDSETDRAWFDSLKPGWQKERIRNFTLLTSGGIADEDLVNDGWTEIIGNLMRMVRDGNSGALARESLSAKVEIADFQKMNQIRDRVDQVVRDRKTADLLKPWYRQFCKRPCFHDEYLDTFNRPNVHLVDTNGQGVECVTEAGVVANGREYRLDCLIFATGFEVGTSFTRRAGFEVRGKGGQTLTEKWSDGMATLHGMATHGFPNMFFLNNSQAAFTANFPHHMDEQSRHISHILMHCYRNGKRRIEVTRDAEEKWVAEIVKLGRMSVKFLESCTPGYYNNEGKPDQRSLKDGFYGAGPVAYFKLLKTWRDAGATNGYDLD